MQKINATLDLNRSLSHFQSTVTEILELDNVSRWDSRTLKSKEEMLREAALTLAGECIALLLHKLSQSKEALQTAQVQTQGWWHPSTKKHGYQSRQVLTLGNVVVNLKLPYVVERPRTRPALKKPKGQGFCPWLRWLGLEEGLTPLSWITLLQYSTLSSSFLAARSALAAWGIRLSLKRIERLTYHFGELGLRLRQAKLLHYKAGTLPTLGLLKDQRVVIAVDGGRTRIRIPKSGKRRAKTNRHGYWGEWIEPKLLVIYTVDERGRKIQTQQIPTGADGTYAGHHALLELLEMYLAELGINQAKQVLLVADGAEWIWKHIPPLLKRLGAPQQTYELIDFYHVTEHLQTFAQAAFCKVEQQKTWFVQARSQLKKGHLNALLQSMHTQRDCQQEVAKPEVLKVLNSQINYLNKNHEEGRLSYAKIQNLKLPIGSGAVESLIRQAVNLRLKGNGKFWLKQHAEILLYLRCQWSCGNWQALSDALLNWALYPKSTG